MTANSRSGVEQVFADALATAIDVQQADAARCESIELAALSGHADEAVAKIALDDPSQVVRLRAIAALSGIADLAWRQLLTGFSQEAPALRNRDFRRRARAHRRTTLLLDEFESGRIKPAESGPRSSIGCSCTATRKSRNGRPSSPPRPSPPTGSKCWLPTNPCSRCTATPSAASRCSKRTARHAIASATSACNWPPDISDSRERTPAQYLTDILQPNRAIDSNYFSYTVFTDSGLIHTGILSAETSTSVTLKQAEGKTVTVPRQEIEELHSSGLSLMPEGLEREIPPQDMCDLIAFIKNWRYLDGQTPLGGQ